MYELYEDIGYKAIRRVSDGAIIPMAEGNADYDAYLRWVAEGNPPVDAPQPQAPQP